MKFVVTLVYINCKLQNYKPEYKFFLLREFGLFVLVWGNRVYAGTIFHYTITCFYLIYLSRIRFASLHLPNYNVLVPEKLYQSGGPRFVS